MASHLATENFGLSGFQEDSRDAASRIHRRKKQVPELCDEDPRTLAAEEGREVNLNIFGVGKLEEMEEEEER